MFVRVGKSLTTLGLIALVTACSAVGQASAPAASPSVSTAASTTPPAADSTANPGGANRPARAPSVAGTVQTVNGTTITVQSAQGGNPATIQLTKDTRIVKQSDVAMSDLTSGTAITAVGQLSGNVVQARRIQVGTNPAAPRQGGGGPGGNGGNGGNGANGGNPPPTVVNGTVDSVTGNTVTVKKTDGTSVQVQLASNGRITQQTIVTAADIVQGKFVMAIGQLQGNTLTATNVNLSDTAPAGRNAPAPQG